MNQVTTNVTLTSNDVPDLSGICTIPTCSLTDVQMNFEFRVRSSYNGSFGFDWMRSKQRGDAIGYEDPLIFVKGDYSKLKDEYGMLSFNSSWSKIECFNSWMTISPRTTAKLKLNEYVATKTTKNTHVDIHIGSVDETGEEIKLIDEYFKITPNKFNSSGFQKTKKNASNTKNITIECLKSFSSTQQIKVFYIKQEEESSKPKVVTLGQLSVLRNDQIKEVTKAVFIKIKTSIGNKRRTGSSSNEEDFLNKYLKQFHCKIQVDTFQNKDGTDSLNLRNDNDFEDLFVISATTRNGLKSQVDESDVLLRTAELKTREDQSIYTDNSFGPAKPWSHLHLSTYLNYIIKDYTNYKDHLKIFFLDEVIVRSDKNDPTKFVLVGGYEAPAYYQHTNSNIVMSKFRFEQDTSHEVLHANGLRHTFPDSPATDNEKFLFKENETFNIMDYEDSSQGKRYYSWKRQWLKLHPGLENTSSQQFLPPIV